MRIVITGPSGSGKTWLSARLAQSLGIRHVELDALHHGPNWESCGAEVLRDRVMAATEEGGWVIDGAYHALLGDLVLERAETFVWLDLPVPLVMWRLIRRTHLRQKHQTELWHGNQEGGWRESLSYVIRPALKRAFENRRSVPERVARHPYLHVHRLRSDRDIERLVRSLDTQPQASGVSAAAD
jgi:adenylate kinase family enzyme